MHHSFIKADQVIVCLKYYFLLIWGIIQQCVYETIQHVDNLRKRLMQNYYDIRCYDWSVAWPCEIVGGGHCEHTLWQMFM